MNGKLSKFLALTAAEKWLFLSAAMLLPLFWLGLRVFGLARLQAWLERSPLAARKSPSVAELSDIGALVNSAAHYAPGPVTCLTRSLLLRWLLRRRGIASDLRIGVQLVQGRLDAHAWVEYEGMPINDAPDVAQRFAAFNEPLSSRGLFLAMSGIAGIIRFDGAPVEPGLVEKMTAAMPYRGPDGINHWVKGSVALGQCMLRTTPESLEETQPLTNEDESLVLVMDGRVDNWEELRRELLGRGAVLRTRSDAELVLRAYETWGRECLPHIDGDFALVIWDARRREAFCARDRVGNKPFNYSWDGKTFVFASELHAILALPGVKEVFNEGLLAEYLANEWYSRDETFWNGVMRLVAAHRMVVDAGGVRMERYWQPDLWATLPCKNDEEYIEHYRELLADVVRRMSRSHQAVAYEVSGGLDSSALFAMAEHLRRQQKLPAPAIEAYALDFHDDPNANELDYSRAMGRHLGVPIREISPTVMSVSWYRNWAERYREFPGYPNGIMAIGLREAARQEGCRAIVSGVGGDEWLGMPWTGAYYAEELASRQWRMCMPA